MNISFRIVADYLMATDDIVLRLDALVNGTQFKITLPMQEAPKEVGPMRNAKYLIAPKGVEYSTSIVVDHASLAASLRRMADAIEANVNDDKSTAPRAGFSFGPSFTLQEIFELSQR